MTGSSSRSKRRLDQIHEITLLLGQRCVAYHPRLVQLTGRVTAGLMLSQAIYWTKRLAMTEPARLGWFWKTREDWRNECGLSRREQDRSRVILKELGLWQEKRVGMPAKVWYRVDLDTLGRLLEPKLYTTWDWRNERAILQLLGRALLFYRPLSDITGAATSAVLLSHLLGHERGRIRTGEILSGWQTYRFDALRHQTGLSRHELDGARLHLRQSALLDERRSGMPPKVEWQLRLDHLIGLLSAGNSRPDATNAELRQPDNQAGTRMVDQFSGNAPSSLQETCKLVCGNPANMNAGNLQTDFPETYQLDFRNRTNWISGNEPTRWAETGKSDGRKSENLYISMTTGIGNTTQTPPPPTPSTISKPGEASNASGGSWSDNLVWPRTLRPEERSWAIKVLADVPEQAQLLLYELAGQSRKRSIESPLGYINTLVKEVKTGRFVPTVALREQARQQREAEDSQLASNQRDAWLKEQARQLRTADAPGAITRTEEEARKRQAGLATLRAFMAQRMGQRRPT
ncbi:hypothetical protein EZJ19_07735 [Parasulfuritortus cantonensis]|uniref:Replication protein O n=1 Tax=Parasulfuritortus cantonensis TaxID=2528202 RepID=A0A4R1BDN3_9PROT|nr:hypothetical protein [Parasulfuritortus cantonensis]TCJ15191.1 hypothetical protein EZJ19_07735 [Parasulfuritortus cantonensis]